MLILINNLTKEEVEFNNSTELREFLIIQNPSFLRKYKEQLRVKAPQIKIKGIGAGIRIVKK